MRRLSVPWSRSPARCNNGDRRGAEQESSSSCMAFCRRPWVGLAEAFNHDLRLHNDTLSYYRLPAGYLDRYGTTSSLKRKSLVTTWARSIQPDRTHITSEQTISLMFEFGSNSRPSFIDFLTCVAAALAFGYPLAFVLEPCDLVGKTPHQKRTYDPLRRKERQDTRRSFFFAFQRFTSSPHMGDSFVSS